jgi:hypothetical protein
MTYEPFEPDAPRYVDATVCDSELLADLEALVRLGFVETVVRSDGELGVVPLLDDAEDDAGEDRAG